MHDLSPLMLIIGSAVGVVSVALPGGAMPEGPSTIVASQHSPYPPTAHSSLPNPQTAPPPSPWTQTVDPLWRVARSETVTLYRVLVQPRDDRQVAQVQTLVSGAFRSSYQGRSVVQVGLYRHKTQAEQVQRLMRREGLTAFVIKERSPLPSSSPTSSGPAANSGVRPLSVPGGWIPVGKVDNGSDLYQGVPPAPPGATVGTVGTGPRYRVVVQPRSDRQQAQIRTLVPDAFRSSYRGQRVIQVGSFPSRSEAEQRMKVLQRHGFKPILEQTP